MKLETIGKILLKPKFCVTFPYNSSSSCFSSINKIYCEKNFVWYYIHRYHFQNINKATSVADSADSWIRIILVSWIWIRIRIKLESWIRILIRITVKSRIRIRNIVKGGSLRGSCWSIGGSKSGGKWVVGSGSGSGSAQNWKAGSGSALEWKVPFLE